MLLGDNLLPLLVLAFGAAMAFGNILALVRPPENRKDRDLAAAPKGRSITMAAVGLVAALWAVASLVKG
ncbi:MAG: hypothetical protein H0U92_09135 [Actinobacteria bacterium]|nr:hypothetical protein [Actinomycetota bacterium]